MIFINSINLIIQIFYTNATSDIDICPDLITLSVEADIERDKYMEYQLYKAYNFLSNLEIITYKCSQKEFLDNDLVELKFDEYFLRIGLLPEYLHTDNFKDTISLQRLTLFDTTEEKIISCAVVSLITHDGFMGFKIPKYFYNELIKLIDGNISSKKIEIRIKINEKIQEFTVLEINIQTDGTIITSTNTMSLNGGFSFLEYFPVSARVKDNNHFLAFLICTMDQLNSPISKIHKFIAYGKVFLYMLNIKPPMFVCLPTFRQDMIFVCGTTHKETEIFPAIKTKIHPYPSYTIDFIVYDFISDSDTFNIEEYIYTDSFEYNLPTYWNHTMKYNERKTCIKIEKSVSNIWNINIKTLRNNCDFEKIHSIIFLFKQGRRKTHEIHFDFDSKKIISEKEVMHSLIIENPIGRLLIILNSVKQIVDSGEGNIIFHFLENKKIRQTFAICFDNGDFDVLVFEQIRKFPVTLLPQYPTMSSIN